MIDKLLGKTSNSKLNLKELEIRISEILAQMNMEEQQPGTYQEGGDYLSTVHLAGEELSKVLSPMNQNEPKAVNYQKATEFLKKVYQAKKDLEELWPESLALLKEIVKLEGGVLTRRQVLYAYALFKGSVVESSSLLDRHMAILILTYLYSLTVEKIHIFSGHQPAAKQLRSLLTRYLKHTGLSIDTRIDTGNVVCQTLREAMFSYNELSLTDLKWEQRDLDERDIVLVDSVDYVLIDNAMKYYYTSKKIIQDQQFFILASEIAETMTGDDYILEREKSTCPLTSKGKKAFSNYLVEKKLVPIDQLWLCYLVEKSLYARHFLVEGEDYCIKDGEIKLLDKKGEVKEQYVYSNGLQECLEQYHGIWQNREDTAMAIGILPHEFLSSYKRIHILSPRASYWSQLFKILYQKDILVLEEADPNRINKPVYFASSEDMIFEEIKRNMESLKVDGTPILICTENSDQKNRLMNYITHYFYSASLTDDQIKENEDPGQLFLSHLEDYDCLVMTREDYLYLQRQVEGIKRAYHILSIGVRYDSTDYSVKVVLSEDQSTVELHTYAVMYNPKWQFGEESKILTSFMEKFAGKNTLKKLKNFVPYAKIRRKLIEEIIQTRFLFLEKKENAPIFLKNIFYRVLERKFSILKSTQNQSLNRLVSSLGLVYSADLEDLAESELVLTLYQQVLDRLDDVTLSYSQLSDSLKTLILRLNHYFEQFDWVKSSTKISEKDYRSTLELALQRLVQQLEEELFQRYFYSEYGQVECRGGTYTGQLIDGVPWGKGKQTFQNREFEGEFVSSTFHGQGTMTYFDGNRYSGEWRGGRRLGQGEAQFLNGDSYKGGWYKGTPRGVGIYTKADGRSFKGSFPRGIGYAIQTNGISTLIAWDNGKVIDIMEDTNVYGIGYDFVFPMYIEDAHYKGEMLENEKHGYGCFTWSDGTVYEGDWLADQRTGKGKLTWADGTVYEGDWLADQRTGKGKLIWADGTVYEGGIRNGLKHGKGIVIQSDNKHLYQLHENDELIESREIGNQFFNEPCPFEFKA